MSELMRDEIIDKENLIDKVTAEIIDHCIV